MSFFIPFQYHKDDQLDGMTVVSPIARGGNGDLYLVRDEYDNHLALKVIRKPDNDDERSGIDQCRAVSSHIPGLVPILRSGKLADNRSYCVMPLADNLAQWPDYEPDTLVNRIRKDGRILPGGVLDIAGEISETVKALHDVGLAHCDIKPENILFIDGRPMLSDYTLLSNTADDTTGDGKRTGTAGTADFIPPEVIENPGYYDPKACDLYALGKVIYCAWTGMEVVLFPSVPQTISLPEIGIIRPLYMKACDIVPSKRFQNADEFISAIKNARFRLDHRVVAQVRSSNRSENRWYVLLAVLLFLLCAIGLVNVFLLSRSGDAKYRQKPDPLSASVPISNPASVSDPEPSRPVDTNAQELIPLTEKTKISAPAPYNGDPVVITSNLDIVDANDGINTLREALSHAQKHGTDATVSFSGNYEIKLSSPLPVSRDVTIDGEENIITIIGPDTEPMFQGTKSKLTLKNLTLVSDRSGDGGGILDTAAKGSATLVSVKDGGKAEWLWNISGKYDMNLDGGSHLHRVRINAPASGDGSIIVRIGTGCMLEDSCISGSSESFFGGNFGVSGQLKNASVADNGRIYLVQGGGISENLTVRNGGFIVHQPGAGMVNGLKVEFGGAYCYRGDVLLTGTVSIGGAACTPLGMAAEKTIVGGETDIVFDLTERTEDSKFGFDYMVDDWIYSIYGPDPCPPIDNMKAFSGARSYTVRVREDQSPGTYLLAGFADEFDSPVSLEIGNAVHSRVLSLGNGFSANDQEYTLSLSNGMLKLTIKEK